MFQIDLKSRKSIYEQVVDNCKALIINGVLPPDEKMPSVRELSKTLTVNPNTVQKAYRELEHQGFIYTSPGLGTFVAKVKEKPVDVQRLTALQSQLKHLLDEFIYLGFDKDKILSIVRQLLEHENKPTNTAKKREEADPDDPSIQPV